MIKDNILRLQTDISLICQRLGRNPQEITVVAITKFATVPMIEEALQSGISHIGENKVQEAVKKYSSFPSPETKVTRHMVGHLQTNKVKDALEIFNVVDYVDSLKLAHTIDKFGKKIKRKVDTLIQVNTSGETKKYGISFKEAMKFLREVSRLDFLRVRGLMTIAPFSDDAQAVRSCFRKLRQLRDQAMNEGIKNIKMDYLSMGMSADYSVAIEEGSNMVRIGRAIFK